MQLSRVAQSLGRLAAAGCRVSRGAAADPRAAPMHSCNSKVAAALEEFRRCAYWNLREHSGLLRHVKIHIGLLSTYSVSPNIQARKENLESSLGLRGVYPQRF